MFRLCSLGSSLLVERPRGMCRQVFELTDPEHPAMKQHREVVAPLKIRQTERGVRAVQVRACFGKPSAGTAGLLYSLEKRQDDKTLSLPSRP